MITPYYIADTFRSDAFKGNPTPVCFTEISLSHNRMISLAKQWNLPVTAFLSRSDKKDTYAIRYFTVTGEIPACGHATLAAAKVVSLLTGKNETSFITRESTVIRTRLEAEIFFMEYPRYDAVPFRIRTSLLESLGVTRFKSVFFCRELDSLFIELETAEELRRLRPDYPSMMASDDLLKEVVVTSPSDNKGYDFLLRSFCPWIGIDEDPVTGSVHSVLAPFWAKQLGKNKLIACQASERGGEIHLNILNERIEIGGKADVIAKDDTGIETEL